METEQVALSAERVTPLPFEIPGATGGQFRIQILNEDAARGVVTSIVHLPPSGRIPAHLHRAGPEMHYVLEGDLVERGESHGPGSFLTHAAGVVHGPHESRGGARVLTVQHWQSHDGQFDFHLAEEGAQAGAAGASAAPDDAAGAAPSPTSAPEGETPAAAGQRQASEQSLGKGYG